MPTQPYMIALLVLRLIQVDLSFVMSASQCLESNISKNALWEQMRRWVHECVLYCGCYVACPFSQVIF